MPAADSSASKEFVAAALLVIGGKITTGGIEPTHGDMTADCVAKAFGVPIDSDPRALAILHSG